LAFRARREETKKIGGVRPSAERPPDELSILPRRAEILEKRDQAPQKPALPLYQRLAPLVEYSHPLQLPLHASIIDAVGSRDALLLSD
jgi:hypothetical protein